MQAASFHVGDPVLRICGDCDSESLRISAITPGFIIAGPRRFDRATLVEVDDFGGIGPSYLALDRRSMLDAMAAAAQDFPGGYR